VTGAFGDFLRCRAAQPRAGLWVHLPSVFRGRPRTDGRRSRGCGDAGAEPRLPARSRGPALTPWSSRSRPVRRHVRLPEVPHGDDYDGMLVTVERVVVAHIEPGTASSRSRHRRGRRGPPGRGPQDQILIALWRQLHVCRARANRHVTGTLGRGHGAIFPRNDPDPSLRAPATFSLPFDVEVRDVPRPDIVRAWTASCSWPGTAFTTRRCTRCRSTTR
jgi:hypothetical protein